MNIQFVWFCLTENKTFFLARRFEETNELSSECKKYINDTCIGGYARLITIVKQLRKTRTNPIYLNAGDNFAGTIWYIFGKWNVTAHFLNLLEADVMVSYNKHIFPNEIHKKYSFLHISN